MNLYDTQTKHVLSFNNAVDLLIFSTGSIRINVLREGLSDLRRYHFFFPCCSQGPGRGGGAHQQPSGGSQPAEEHVVSEGGGFAQNCSKV